MTFEAYFLASLIVGGILSYLALTIWIGRKDPNDYCVECGGWCQTHD